MYKHSGQDADNTVKNIQDRDHAEPTPLDQGSSSYDINTTQLIRKKVLNLKGLSVNGQNIKIITNQGHIVFRGPVDTLQEHKEICSIAAKVAGKGNVDDQQEVKAKSSDS